MRIKFFQLLLVFCLAHVLGGHSLMAQVINAEQKRAFQNNDGWVGNADLAFGLTKNTRLILQAGSRINVQYHKKKAYTALAQ